MIEQIKEPEFFVLNPRRAERFLNMRAMDGDRDVKTRLLNNYANKMRSEEPLFHPPTIATAILNYNGREEIRINGQHVCLSVIQANKKLIAVRLRFACDTSEDLSRLYQQFDQGYGTRSLQDFTRIEARTSLNLTWPIRICSLVVSAAALRTGKQNLTKEQKVALLKHNLDQGNFVNYILNTSLSENLTLSDVKHLKKAPIVLGMIFSWEKCQRVAEDFWIRVRDGEGLLKSDPTKLLRDFLMTATINIGRKTKFSDRQSVSPHEILYRIAVAWNGFRQKKKMKILKYYPTKNVPRFI